MPRNPDGRFRAANKAAVITTELIISRWVEGEIVQLRFLGLSFVNVRQQILKVARGEAQPATPLPATVAFPPGWTIADRSVYCAHERGLRRYASMSLLVSA